MSLLPVWLVSAHAYEKRKKGSRARVRKSGDVQNIPEVKNFLATALDSCGYDLHALLLDQGLAGHVFGWAVLELIDEVDAILSVKSLQRRSLLEWNNYVPLLHFKIKHVIPLQTPCKSFHAGLLPTPASRVYQMHTGFVELTLMEQTASGGGTVGERVQTSYPQFGGSLSMLGFEMWLPICIECFWTLG